jgi:hypothetical protein
MGLDTAPPSSCSSVPPAPTGEPARPVLWGFCVLVVVACSIGLSYLLRGDQMGMHLLLV